MLASLLVGLLVGATPQEGTRWVLSYEDVLSLQVAGAPPGMRLTPRPTLGRSSIELKIDAVTGETPKRLTLAMKSGPAELAGRTWAVEENYGDAIVTEKKDPSPRQRDAVLDSPGQPESLKGLRHLTRVLVVPDPVVAAAREGKPCDAGTREKVAVAAAHLVDRLISNRPGEMTVKAASAECLGTSGRYTVRFTLSSTVLDAPNDALWSGTVEVAPDAWRADLDLKATVDFDLRPTQRTLRAHGTMRLKSRLTQLR